MSYCRWSTYDYQCDVYCYASERGYETSVASNRLVLPDDMPPPVPFDADHLDEWLARHKVVSAMLAHAERRPIGLPMDDEQFLDYSAAEAADRLQSLKDMGYNVPLDAINDLREEARLEGTT